MTAGSPELAALRQRWISEVFNNSWDIDPSGELVWSDLLYGFLLGAGVARALAVEISCGGGDEPWPY